MSTRASWHRYVVMEALVTMCSGKSNINLEDIAKKLVDVLVVVILYPDLEIGIPSSYVGYCNCQIPPEKRCVRKQFPQIMCKTALSA